MLLKASVKAMSFSSGVQGSLKGSSCYNSFELCAFSFVWFLEVKKNVLLGLQTFPSSLILNPFPPLSSMNNPKCRTFYFGFFFPPWLQGGYGKACDKRQHRRCSQGPEPPASPVSCTAVGLVSFCPFPDLLDSSQPVSGLSY